MPFATTGIRDGGARPVIMDDREILAAIRARLLERVGKERYDVWFGPGTQIVVRGETLEIGVRDQFFQDWLRSNFRKDLEAVAQEVCGRPLALEFRIAPPGALPPPSAAAAACAAQSQRENGSPQNGCRAGAAPDRSLAEATRRRQLASLDAFVVGNSNRVAHTTAQVAAQQPGTYSPLLVHGPIGSGKTHLLEGIYAEFRRLRPRASTVYLSAEQFTSCFLEALHGSGLPSFRRKYRHVELLVLDDIQFFAGKRATLVEVLHTVETLLRARRQLVFAADRPPTALKMLGPELLARVSGGMVCRLEPAEYATRLGIVRQVATRLELAVPADVEAFIASHFTTQSRELTGALQRLQLTSQAHQRPITLALAEEALAELIDHQGRVVKLADIERAVCDVFGLEPASLQSGGKTKAVSHPRMLAMFLARKHTRAALSQIGSYFGRRSHSTVISAQKKVESWMANGTAVQLENRSLTLEETIRRVEERLRAG
jgi:chromosomal replication initiator protein